MFHVEFVGGPRDGDRQSYQEPRDHVAVVSVRMPTLVEMRRDKEKPKSMVTRYQQRRTADGDPVKRNGIYLFDIMSAVPLGGCTGTDT